MNFLTWEDLCTQNKIILIQSFYRENAIGKRFRWICCNSQSQTHIGIKARKCCFIRNKEKIDIYLLDQVKLTIKSPECLYYRSLGNKIGVKHVPFSWNSNTDEFQNQKRWNSQYINYWNKKLS